MRELTPFLNIFRCVGIYKLTLKKLKDILLTKLKNH